MAHFVAVVLLRTLALAPAVDAQPPGRGAPALASWREAMSDALAWLFSWVRSAPRKNGVLIDPSGVQSTPPKHGARIEPGGLRAASRKNGVFIDPSGLTEA